MWRVLLCFCGVPFVVCCSVLLCVFVLFVLFCVGWLRVGWCGWFVMMRVVCCSVGVVVFWSGVLRCVDAVCVVVVLLSLLCCCV